MYFLNFKSIKQIKEEKKTLKFSEKQLFDYYKILKFFLYIMV